MKGKTIIDIVEEEKGPTAKHAVMFLVFVAGFLGFVWGASLTIFIISIL